jgi:hypothetical protein
MMEIELKPCPFCGGEASSEGRIRYLRPLDNAEWDDGSPITEAFYVSCMKCGAVARSGIIGGYRTRAEAETVGERIHDHWKKMAGKAPLERGDMGWGDLVQQVLRAARDVVSAREGGESHG